LVTLKADGTLWRWQMPFDPVRHPESARAVPMSRHSDWLGLADGNEGVFSLAADGGLWLWDLKTDGFGLDGRQNLVILLAPSRFPKRLASVQE
jgi:hypothetical protein